MVDTSTSQWQKPDVQCIPHELYVKGDVIISSIELQKTAFMQYINERIQVYS